MNTHRVILRANDTVSVLRQPTVPPAAGELSVATAVAGLCGTDVQMLRGLRDDPAPVIGHEGIATVVAAGLGVGPELMPGTLVAVNPTHPTDSRFLLGHNVNGLLQERTLLPETAVSGGLVLPLPPGTDVALGPLLEPLAVVCYSFGVLRAVRPRTLLVVGDGTVGHLAVRAARRLLGEHVRTVLVHHTAAGRAFSATAAHRADMLLDAGGLAELRCPGERVAALLCTPRDATVEALEAVLGIGADVLTVDVIGGLPTGAGTPLLPGADLVAIRAANCAGLPQPAETATLTTSDGQEVTVFGHRGVANLHLVESAGELAADPYRYGDLVTHVVDLESAARIMAQLARSRARTVGGRRLIKLGVRVNHRIETEGTDGG
ncbi:alcohol dehydrogenase catalytic domain-containing protein [Frankia sp. CiP3]|uniref:alcohol dehydrogenase catalytic domain-containing protein n=1 Tax=Frankia sp. CiP3 TaxID=2880971 RepID=UPI001EF40698|nr:alcohol dehydrogenase catalytic domain-containing protein [Frankia sp. CiP3]